MDISFLQLPLICYKYVDRYLSLKLNELICNDILEEGNKQRRNQCGLVEKLHYLYYAIKCSVHAFFVIFHIQLNFILYL